METERSAIPATGAFSTKVDGLSSIPERLPEVVSERQRLAGHAELVENALDRLHERIAMYVRPMDQPTAPNPDEAPCNTGAASDLRAISVCLERVHSKVLHLLTNFEG